MASALEKRVARLEDIVDVLLLAAYGHLKATKDPALAERAVPAIRRWMDDPTRENYVAALGALDAPVGDAEAAELAE